MPYTQVFGRLSCWAHRAKLAKFLWEVWPQQAHDMGQIGRGANKGTGEGDLSIKLVEHAFG